MISCFMTVLLGCDGVTIRIEKAIGLLPQDEKRSAFITSQEARQGGQHRVREETFDGSVR
jgi:hypothetical protein